MYAHNNHLQNPLGQVQKNYLHCNRHVLSVRSPELLIQQQSNVKRGKWRNIFNLSIDFDLCSWKSHQHIVILHLKKIATAILYTVVMISVTLLV